MNVAEYIESGILELYLAGLLSEKENEEVNQNIAEHPEVRKEVELIEKALVYLTSYSSPLIPESFKAIEEKLETAKEVSLAPWSKLKRLGWAAIFIALFGGLIWLMQDNKRLQTELFSLINANDSLENQITEVRDSLNQREELLTALREKEVVVVDLGGQGKFEDYYAKAYWNKKAEVVYVDVKALPTPPEGMVYQLWSLTLNPLSPTSLGLLDDFEADADKIFDLKNPYASEAFGITLEPEGGSETPTMDQLYTLGVLPSS